jgi:predicted RNA-binding protein YlqC (UPF0109 family)
VSDAPTAGLVDMLTALAKGLVDHPDQVRVESDAEGETTVLNLFVAPEDLGQVIGRGGRIARALRLIVREAAFRSGVRVSLEIVD